MPNKQAEPDPRYVSGTCDVDTPLSDLHAALGRQGVPLDHIRIQSTIPIEPVEQTKGLHITTIVAGLMGIGIGLLLSAGTALLYQIETGGKPIVSWPVVGIISYEVMMLFAIVSTFIAMAVRIRRAAGDGYPTAEQPDEGRARLIIRVDQHAAEVESVVRVLEQAGARDIHVFSPPQGRAHRLGAVAGSTTVLVLGLILAGCPDNMSEQPSVQSQEAPRRHSPAESIPRSSRSVVGSRPATSDAMLARGRQLFGINCSHCHGETGSGDGPVAGFLTELPANLQGRHVRTKSPEALYGIISNGRHAMPAFRGELSADERWALAYYVNHLSERDE